MLTVWMDSWQIQCCGDPFSVGSHVAWTLHPASDPEFASEVLGPELAATLTHHEEHHGGLPDDAPVTEGRVRSITAVWCKYGPVAGRETKTLYPIPGSLVTANKQTADGWEKEADELRFLSYLVELDPSDGE